MKITAYSLAQRFVGVREVPGAGDNDQILAMLRLDAKWPEGDSVPWCSAFVNYIAWLLRLPRSKSLRARSWLTVGMVVGNWDKCKVGFDVVILERGPTPQPGPETIEAPGHVGFYAGFDRDRVLLLGGNQSDSVSLGNYPMEKILGIRRLYE